MNESVKNKVLEWFGTGRVGLSSAALALGVCGIASRGDHPHDPDDLNRCLLLLERVPELRLGLDRMRTVSPVWDRLVENWSRVETRFLEEVGLDWCKAHSAPETYALMKELGC